MSELLQCGWNENVRQCHWINCHGEGPCSGIPASQFTRSRADEITRLQSSLAAANERVKEQEAVIGGMREAMRKTLTLYDADYPQGLRTMSEIFKPIRVALANAPARASDYWKAMREVVEAGERLVGCEIVSISWANAYDAFRAAQSRLRSLEDKAGETS